MKTLAYFCLLTFLLIQCKSSDKKLPFYGVSIIQTPQGYDTIYNPLPNFEFTNHMGHIVSNETLKGKPFVADFFFTSCPGICPKMTRNMLTLYEKYPNQINFISHSVDPKRDSIQKLNTYAKKIGITDDKSWHFVRGEKEEISRMADTYMVIAYEDSTVSGGFEHGGQFILVDKNAYVRGFYDGLDKESVAQLEIDIAILLKEK